MAKLLVFLQGSNFEDSTEVPYYSRAAYLETLTAMIKKSWLSIQSDPRRERHFFRQEGLPRPADLVPRSGCIAITSSGEKLFRRMISVLEGPAALRRRDAICVAYQSKREYHYYAPTLGLCREQASYLPIGIQGQHIPGLKNCVEVVSKTGPERCGPWRSSRHFVHKRGYRLIVRYREIRPRRFQDAELGIDATILSYKPVAMRGTILGNQFRLYDNSVFAKQRRTPFFRWLFRVFAPPNKSRPSLELKERRQHAGFQTIFRRTEEENGRREPLSTAAMKQIATTMAAEYLRIMEKI